MGAPGRSHARILDLLGGRQAVADALGLPNRKIVSHWRHPDRGIPPIYWGAILRLAARRRLRLTWEELEAASPRRRAA